MTIAHNPEPRIPPSTLAIRLQQAREWRSHNQAELAEVLDVGRTTISNYENGVTTPSKLQINAWAAFCDVDVEWLKTGSEQPHNWEPDGGPSEDSGKITFGLLASGNVTHANFSTSIAA